MIRLVHSRHGFSFMLEENSVYEIVIEHPELLADVVRELNRQCEGGEGEFLLSCGQETLDIAKNICFVPNLFSVDSNHRRILGKVYQEIEKNIQNDFSVERTKFNEAYIDYLDYICKINDVFLSYNDMPQIQDVLKMAQVKIDTKYDTLLEQIVEYIKVITTVLKQQIFVLLNVKLYLSEKDIKRLYQECFNRKVQLVLLEAVYREKLPEEAVCIIDRERCIIYP